MERVRVWSIAAACCALLFASTTAANATSAPRAAGISPETFLDGASGVVSAYTLIVPRSASQSQLQVRAVIPAGINCPPLEVTFADGNEGGYYMGTRTPGATTGAAFANVRACEGNLPADAVAASVGGISVPASLPETIRKLGIIGDTGCRLKGSDIQDCANEWPLAQNAATLAGEHPDAIIMVGDFFYREAKCPSDKQDLCGGSPAPIEGMPFKDTQYAWMADVFIPMAPMFAAAPILVVRGNHEACNRGGNGYFLFFDSSPLGPSACAPIGDTVPQNITPSWSIDLPTAGKPLRLVTVDTAYGDDSDVSSWVTQQQLQYQRAWKRAQRGNTPVQVWMLTHRPLFGLVSNTYSSGPTFTPWTSMDQEASAEGLLDPYKAIVSGHIHLAQAVTTPGEPAQVLVGNGGTALDPSTGYAIPPYGPLLDGTGAPVSPFFAPYPNATSQWTDVQYGHAIAKPGGSTGQWHFRFKTPTGDTFATCTLQGRSVACS